jgi:hypothetical protein
MGQRSGQVSYRCAAILWLKFKAEAKTLAVNELYL